ncbi:hypothetical protein GCM10010493_23240 [Streptomyces lavendulae subsp. grasserius]
MRQPSEVPRITRNPRETARRPEPPLKRIHHTRKGCGGGAAKSPFRPPETSDRIRRPPSRDHTRTDSADGAVLHPDRSPQPTSASFAEPCRVHDLTRSTREASPTGSGTTFRKQPEGLRELPPTRQVQLL